MWSRVDKLYTGTDTVLKDEISNDNSFKEWDVGLNTLPFKPIVDQKRVNCESLNEELYEITSSVTLMTSKDLSWLI